MREKDMYDLFAEEYEKDLREKDELILESGFILFRERFYGEEWELNITRICVNNNDFVFEDDFFEGQECEYISSITDTEIRHYIISNSRRKTDE